MNISTDPFYDFFIKISTEQNNLFYSIQFGNLFPDKAKKYLKQYIQQTYQYKNLYNQWKELRFSLYQPPLNEEAEKRYLYYRLLRKWKGIRIPATITIGITKKCQCHCIHCSANYHMNHQEKDLTTQEYIQAIQESIHLGVTNIIFVGGEPLLNYDLETIISSIPANMAIPVIFTNGEFLTSDRCIKLKRAGLRGIFVSLDSYQEEEHNLLRKRKIFSKAIEGIQNAIQSKIPIAISSYLTSEKVEKGYIDHFMELGKQLQVQEVTFFDAIPTGRMYSYIHSFLNPKTRKIILERTIFYRKKKDYPIITPQSVFTSEYGKGFCFAATTQFYISSQGYVCPCDFTPLTAGKFPEFSIQELWKRLISFSPYQKRAKVCRMQNPEFRKRYIESIPPQAKLPYPIECL